MKYLKDESLDEPLPESVTYYELDDDDWPIRQIAVNTSQSIASNRNEPGVGLYLADIQINSNELTDLSILIEINKGEFEGIWSSHLVRFQDEWESAKKRYPVGVHVKGILNCFIPQGVIVVIEEGVLGVADYEECRNSTVPMNMYPGHRVTGVVKGYDEVNQWVILGDARVGEVVTDYTWNP